MSFIDVSCQFVVLVVDEGLGSSCYSIFVAVSCCFSYPRVETLVEIRSLKMHLRALANFCRSILPVRLLERFAVSGGSQPWFGIRERGQ
jgi:hypothetical protein